MPLIDILPDADAFLALQPEDLGMVLLKLLQAERKARFTPSDLQYPLWVTENPAYPHSKKEAVTRAFAEAWQWLQSEGLLMNDPNQSNDWFCLTRKGKKITTDGDIETYRQGNLLPTELLHSSLAEKVRPMFLRGDYETAVFQAFKEVEVAVRKAGAFPNELVGVALMRRAFHPQTGQLSDGGNIAAEREALMHLFGGAIGHAKNPPSHREVTMERTSAAQLIIFASYLLMQLEASETLRAIGLISPPTAEAIP